METHWWHGKHLCHVVCHVVFRCVLTWPLFALPIFRRCLTSVWEEGGIIIRAPSPRVLFNGLSQTPHVSLRGWSTKKGRFFYMVCPVTFIDTCSMASLDQSRVTSIGCIPDGILPFLNYPSDFS